MDILYEDRDVAVVIKPVGLESQTRAPMRFSSRLTFPHRGKTRSFEAYPAWAESE